MAVKTNQELKRQKKAVKKAKVEKVTNWFMINLAWGVLGFIVLRYMEQSIITPPNGMYIPAIIFGVIAAALLVLGLTKVIKNKNRAIHYAVFSAIVAIICLYFNFYPSIRNTFPSLISILRTSQWWTTNLVSLGIGVYLVGAFIYTSIKVAIIEKKK